MLLVAYIAVGLPLGVAAAVAFLLELRRPYGGGNYTVDLDGSDYAMSGVVGTVCALLWPVTIVVGGIVLAARWVIAAMDRSKAAAEAVDRERIP